MSDHPDFIATKARHKAEIDDLTMTFGTRYADLMNAEGPARDVKAIHALRAKHRTDITEAVYRHAKVENTWLQPGAVPDNVTEPKED